MARLKLTLASSYHFIFTAIKKSRYTQSVFYECTKILYYHIKTIKKSLHFHYVGFVTIYNKMKDQYGLWYPDMEKKNYIEMSEKASDH